LFYVLSPAQGRHRFSRDYDEFLRHKRLYKKERDAR
jgi:cell division protein YceG involved in septum cleavage